VTVPTTSDVEPVSQPDAGPRGVSVRPGPSTRDRLRDGVDRLWRPLALIAACGLLWWLVTALGRVPGYLVPSPGRTWRVMVEQGGYLWQNTLTTTGETLVGFVLAAVAGVLAAVVMVYSVTVERTLYPLLLFAQVVPKIAIAPLFIVWLGFGTPPKIVVAVLMAFFPIVISGVTGLRSVDPELLELVATMGAKPLQTFRKIRFPAALPHLFSGLKVAATLAVTGAVVGEFVGANEGLGYVILQANGNLDTPMLFAGLIIMSLLGVLLFAVIEVAEHLLLPWHSSRRSSPVTATY
jgi:NitT/TauT family transport system permease protein